MEYGGILAGLGNPGGRYEGTRHNCGFEFVDEALGMAAKNGEVEDLGGGKFNARLWRARFPYSYNPWLVVKPQTFMNDSGNALQPLMAWYKLAPGQLVVAHDELDIPPGELRFKYGGGLAGHRGLDSIARRLGSKDFYRLRIGIGKPASKEEILNWVLSRPNVEDRRAIEEAMPIALETLEVFSAKGYAAAQQCARKAKNL